MPNMKPTVLIILDGFGERAEIKDNAVKQADTPHLNSFLKNYPHTLIEASGKAVGLPAGLMGNSEVGHLTLGAGRIVLLGLTRIYAAIEEGSFFKNSVLVSAMDAALQNNSALHLLGLVSDGAVHSHQDHLYALLKMAKQKGLEKVYIHAFTDGRDTAPKMADVYLMQLQDQIRQIGVGQIATVSGRFYAMDRDKRWERIQLAYEAIVEGKGRLCSTLEEAVQTAFQHNETDEFILPTVLALCGRIQSKDSVLFFNFRADRAREMTQALTQQNFEGFERKTFPSLSYFGCFSEYDAGFNLPVAFPKIDIRETFPEILSQKGLRQLRIAETEKYAHVTFFFSGGVEQPYPGEDRILVPSPKEVPTYDLKPEMSAKGITEKLLKALDEQKYDFVICNFANPDMVGHTGNLPAAIRAVEVVDECLGQLVEKVLSQQGSVVITADHGNCEKMKDERGNPHTAHTIDLVPFILISENYRGKSSEILRQGGGLPDIAPTLLKLMHIPQPARMMGKSLVLT
ncbi:MAG: 2,3-bisphosphoglycerate-independent phosphoglycerate mutase [Deltaproteobacteria bacterium]|nr:2,3-bisphosphoglycerate-independent phosphoglycerate mutase [Deltaproteobacteria bacterium]